jgi:hypothetical protein
MIKEPSPQATFANLRNVGYRFVLTEGKGNGDLPPAAG